MFSGLVGSRQSGVLFLGFGLEAKIFSAQTSDLIKDVIESFIATAEPRGTNFHIVEIWN